MVLLLLFKFFKLGWSWSIKTWSTFTFPSKTFSSGKSLSLTIKSASTLCSTKSKLRWWQVGVITFTIVSVFNAFSSSSSDWVAGCLAKRLTQITTRGKQILQVAQTDRFFTADAITIPITNTTGLTKGDTTSGASPVTKSTTEPCVDQYSRAGQNNQDRNFVRHFFCLSMLRECTVTTEWI